MAKRSFYRPHNRVTFDNSLVNRVTGEIEFPPSMAKQEFKAECDINNILKQFSATGMMRHVSAKAAEGMYTDLPDQQDFQESLEIVRTASESFASLPSKVRDRFHNEPHEFLAFMGDPKNSDEIRALGLAQALPARPEPISVRIIDPIKDGGNPPS